MEETLIASIFKTNTLIGIEIHDRKEHTGLQWQPFKRVSWPWGWLCDDQKEGFKEWWSSSYVYTKEELETGGYLDIPLLVELVNPPFTPNTFAPIYKVYYHARVTFIFTEGRKFHKYFDTKEEAEKYAQQQKVYYLNESGSMPVSFKLTIDKKK